MIEIMGLPGSGKSYLLNNANISNVIKIDESKYDDECKKISFLKKMSYLFITTICFFDALIALFLYVLFFSRNKKYCLKQYCEFYKYLVLFNCIVHKYKKNLIVDQGVLQFIWSIIIFDKGKMKRNRLIGYSYSRFSNKYKIFVFYYKVDYSLAAKQATNREKKCIGDYLSFEELNSLYCQHYYDYKTLCKYINKNKFYIIESIDEFEKYFNDVEVFTNE